MITSRVASLVAVACLLAGSPARADDEQRELPDYGRPQQPTTPGDVLLWVPRVVFFPAYVVSEFVIRRPLGFVVTEAERAEVPAALYDFFAFGPDHKAGIVPIAFIDFGFDPSVGLYTFWDDAGFEGHDLRLRGSTWGTQWLTGTFIERFHFGAARDLTLRATLTRRPDYTFYGIGPDTREDALSRYSADTAEFGALFSASLFGTSSLSSSLGYRGQSFGPGDYDRDPTVTESVAQGRFALPPGYDEGYTAVVSAGSVVLDSRSAEGSESGVRLRLKAEQGTDLGPSPPGGWLRYGGTLGAFVDLTETQRVLGLSVAAELAEPIGTSLVPFTELVALGGPELMPGFRDGRLRGESALVTTLRYSWPIWIWLDGSLQAAVGNVFGQELEGTSIEASRFSGAVGIESNGSRDSVFQALLGFGTETFESGAAVNSIRLTVGARSGF